MECKILVRLIKGYKLTKNQIIWIREHIEPKYTNECEHCRFNVMLHFGLVK